MAKPEWADLPGAKEILGIHFYSRAGDQLEEEEMRQFIELAEERDVLDMVDGLFYDSQLGVCRIAINPNLRKEHLEAKRIYLAAAYSLSQFEWLGEVHQKI